MEAPKMNETNQFQSNGLAGDPNQASYMPIPD
jgi:hypothetical protein